MCHGTVIFVHLASKEQINSTQHLPTWSDPKQVHLQTAITTTANTPYPRKQILSSSGSKIIIRRETKKHIKKHPWSSWKSLKRTGNLSNRQQLHDLFLELTFPYSSIYTLCSLYCLLSKSRTGLKPNVKNVFTLSHKVSRRQSAANVWHASDGNWLDRQNRVQSKERKASRKDWQGIDSMVVKGLGPRSHKEKRWETQIFEELETRSY